ncbi:hypothetical protein C8A03DRAFT_47648 [Achaetomium macrosporum]|uniref:F-box domain-containing protein n=1 Tax=Achaetomium macrosporum TaxID=79813 RepID=A0AAN7C2M9_9PEZI|nr:hypothetical protein C8A03DRAFT_47648 [Achaetomium macrosporum]
MLTITDLPCEIVGEILGNLDHLQFLLPALACRHFYISFKECHGVEASILCRQITPALLPYSVTLMEASRLPRPLVGSSVDSLLDELYSQPARLAARLPELPTTLIRNMSRTHNTIHTLATDFAASALERISPQSASTSKPLSPTEYFRFCRAFYLVDLFYTLFRHDNEQLGCVYEYLEVKFAEASFDVVAHDVVFGGNSVDYLTVGEDNYWRQTWLSRGVEFVYQLTTADSYDAKHRMLRTTLYSSYVNLPGALRRVCDDVDGGALEEYYEEFHSIALGDSDPSQEDTDRGPLEAWRKAKLDCSLELSCMFPDNDWLRERAYVLWDWERVQDLGDKFWEYQRHQGGYTEQDWEDMLECFDERYMICENDARGYWSKGDTSRIIWPDGPDD